MVSVLQLRLFTSSLCTKTGITSLLTRHIATSPQRCDDRDSWLTKLLHVRKIEPQKESHSRMLSDKEVIYELHTHYVIPGVMDAYLKNYGEFVNVANKRKDLDAELIGSWVSDVGDQDQALHLWRYVDGYNALNKATNLIRTDKVDPLLPTYEYASLTKDRAKLLRSRHCQYLLSFSFWNVPKARPAKHIYEIRSYVLKPGTMIEWGNNWAKAIHFRQNNSEAFCGLFSQVGRLYNVHHVWVYDDLKSRKETRAAAWQKPGWDECVAYTVPLIKDMESRILIPTDFSPTL